MSGKTFNDSSVGEYSFELQSIEIDNYTLGVSDDNARKVIKNSDLYDLSGQELKFYQTYLHEFIHYLDGTATLWGLEFCARLYQFYETGNDDKFDVLSLNSSEIFLHNKFEHRDEQREFTKLTVGLNYDGECGIHSIVHYEFNGNPLYSAPLSLLSVLEGHAYSQEQLFTWKVYTKQNDKVSLALLKRDVEALLKDPCSGQVKLATGL